MKSRRILVKGVGVYHVFNRTAYARYVLDDGEREMFVRMMRKQAAFCGIEILCYCVLSNHYHLLVRVPDDRKLDDAELLSRYKNLYQDEPAPKAAMRPSDLWAVLQQNGDQAVQIRDQLHERMHRLSVFMKELQQRFGIWYNHTHGNKGTLWSERYRSVIVEHNPRIMQIVAAYIELNPVRAGIVDRPEAFRWCSISAALAGDHDARSGIRSIMGHLADYEHSVHMYVLLVQSLGGYAWKPESEDPNLDHVSPGQNQPSALRERISAFTRGAIVGTATFVDSFRIQRKHHPIPSDNQKSATHCILEYNGDTICSFRNRTVAMKKQSPDDN